MFGKDFYFVDISGVAAPTLFSHGEGGLEYTGEVWKFLGALGPLGFPKKAAPSENLYTPLLPAW